VGPGGLLTEYKEMKGKPRVDLNSKKIVTEDIQIDRARLYLKNKSGNSHGLKLFKSVYLNLLEKFLKEQLEQFLKEQLSLVNEINNKSSIDNEAAQLIQNILVIGNSPIFQIYVYSIE
jgi:hypothetical protein